MELLELMQQRHSVRAYTEEHVSPEKLEKIVQAGLLAPSGMGKRPWEFIVIRKKETLEQMVASRTAGAQMLAGADAAVVVLVDEEKAATWLEDGAIVMAYMQLMAQSLGVGSCWVQGRGREAQDGRSTEDYLRALLRFPEQCRLVATLSLGIPAERKTATALSALQMEKIHWEQY